MIDWKMEKIATFAPMPNASMATASRANPGARRKWRKAAELDFRVERIGLGGAAGIFFRQLEVGRESRGGGRIIFRQPEQPGRMVRVELHRLLHRLADAIERVAAGRVIELLLQRPSEL